MNAAHVHLLVNHLPIIGVLIGTLVLIAGFIFRQQPTLKLTALAVLIFASLAAVPAYLSGEGAEEIAEQLPGVTEIIIEQHEDAAKFFLIASIALGCLSIITMLAILFKPNLSTPLYWIVLLVAVGTFGLGANAGSSGGKIRHTEIRNDTSVVPSVNMEKEADND